VADVVTALQAFEIPLTVLIAGAVALAIADALVGWIEQLSGRR
jgi:hypothetical protein